MQGPLFPKENYFPVRLGWLCLCTCCCMLTQRSTGARANVQQLFFHFPFSFFRALIPAPLESSAKYVCDATSLHRRRPTEACSLVANNRWPFVPFLLLTSPPALLGFFFFPWPRCLPEPLPPPPPPPPDPSPCPPPPLGVDMILRVPTGHLGGLGGGSCRYRAGRREAGGVDCAMAPLRPPRFDIFIFSLSVCLLSA